MIEIYYLTNLGYQNRLEIIYNISSGVSCLMQSELIGLEITFYTRYIFSISSIKYETEWYIKF